MQSGDDSIAQMDVVADGALHYFGSRLPGLMAMGFLTIARSLSQRSREVRGSAEDFLRCLLGVFFF